LPENMIQRAKALLTLLEEQSGTDLTAIDMDRAEEYSTQQKNEAEEKVLSALRNMDINSITPFEALSLLNDFKQRIQ